MCKAIERVLVFVGIAAGVCATDVAAQVMGTGAMGVGATGAQSTGGLQLPGGATAVPAGVTSQPGTPRVSGVLTGPVITVPIDPGPVPVPYETVDNLEGDWVNLMNPPYRPMVLSDDGFSLWAVDNHNNQVHYFSNGTGTPTSTFGVPVGPVSIAKWTDGSDLRLIVVCRTSWVVCLLDADTGEILDVLQMEDPATGRQLGEPADIVVVGDDAWVTASASDAVVEIDLTTFSIANVLYMPSKHPTFLSVDTNGDILVVPQASGNNTLVHRPEGSFIPGPAHVGELGVIDGADTSVVINGLNDYDVFRIDTTGVTPVMSPAAQHVGTVMFAHAVNPFTGDFWALNTDANTKDPTMQTEPTINGKIAFNQLSLMTLTAGQVVTPGSTFDLDLHPDGMGGFAHDPTRAVGQPFNLCMTDAGFAFVVGLLTDNVTLLDPQGNFFLEWDLSTAGSIPRAVEYSLPLNTAFVYCWGTNVIEGYDLNDTTSPWITLDLGYDPTPRDLKDGRATFFDAGNSLNNRFACTTCHIDGGFDGIAWNIEQDKDPKGPMITQTMTGLETVHPFHWRGEQEGIGDQLMIDFNEAFEGLLGGAMLDTTPGGKWEKFEDFVFSMQSPANPNQNIERLVDPDIDAPLFPGFPDGDPVDGQANFILGCASCHSFPKGTSNDFIADGIQDHHPHQMDFKVPPFQEDYRWEQDADTTTPGIQLETVDFVPMVPNLPNSDFFPPLGVAFTHAGLFTNLHHFVLVFNVFTNTLISSLTDYIHQWDNGLAPVAHRAYHVDDTTPNSVFKAIRNYLVPQTSTGMTTGSGQTVVNGDLAVIGTFEWQTVERDVRWYLDAASGLLVPDDSTIPPQVVGTLLAQAKQGKSTNTFIGMPFGTARRFAIDYDGDGLPNQDEEHYPGGGTDPEVKDSDGDGWWDGYEDMVGSDPTLASSVPGSDPGPPDFVNDTVDVLWTTAKTAVLRFEVTEQARVDASYVTTGAGGSGDSGLVKSRFGYHHRLVLANLDPLQTYQVTIDIIDHFGMSKQKVVSFNTKSFVGLVDRTKVASLSFTQLPVTPTSPMTLRVEAANRFSLGSPPTPAVGYQVVARVCLDGQFIDVPADLDTQGGPSAFTVVAQPYTVLPGPFTISTALTDGSGFADLTFALPTALSGQTVTVVIEAIQLPGAGWTPSVPDFDHLANWSHSDTPKLLRTIDLVLP